MIFEEREAYNKGYKDGISDGNICNGTFRKRIKEAYENGLNDAWECARKIYLNTDENGLSGNELYAIFGERGGYILKEYSASEAIAKIKEYDEIKVGDEVYCSDRKAVVSRVVENEILAGKLYSIVFFNGATSCVNGQGITKTGRYFPQIVEVFEQMRG